MLGISTVSAAIAVLAMAMLATAAHAANVDWKMYGGASVAGSEYCFYEATSLTRTPAGRARVWVKCLLEKDLESIDPDHNKDLFEKTAKKLKSGYIPPIILLKKVNFDLLGVCALYEQAANLLGFQPVARFYYEIDCSQRRLRHLSMEILIKGKRQHSDEPTDWSYVPPEGSAATLLKLLCPRR